ncbi:MAG: RNA 2',3'-cyclic phosphodiesterase [Planctomycetota bacterium]
MSAIRTFVAVNASSRVTNNVSRVVSRLAATEAGYNWVDQESLHVTLNYIGDVNDVEIPELCKLIKQSVEPFSPFDLSLKGVSGFPRPEQPRVLWMGVDEGSESLEKIYRALEETLYEWGVNKDRRAYVPHMTLGRVARGGRWNEALLALMHRLRNHDGGFCSVNEVVVYSSYLDRSGPTYTPMSRIALRP